MKRCPQCLFLYPESDETCDFDHTLLEDVDDSAIDAVTTNASKSIRSGVRPLFIAAVIGLLLGVTIFAVYFLASNRTSEVVTSVAGDEIKTSAAVIETKTGPPLDPPQPSVSPSPSPSTTAPPNTTSKQISTSHTRATLDPVSTSGPGMATRRGGKPVIILTSGAKIEADEVWRTRDGVWYRRNGVVTLLKRTQVKSIVTR